MAAKKTTRKATASKVSAKPKVAKPKASSIDNMGYPNKRATKAGQDARKRAAKSGKIVGKTSTISDKYNRTLGEQHIESQTRVKSSRGNLYDVWESKNQKPFLPDTNRKSKTFPVAKDFKLKPRSPRLDPRGRSGMGATKPRKPRGK